MRKTASSPRKSWHAVFCRYRCDIQVESRKPTLVQAFAGALTCERMLARARRPLCVGCVAVCVPCPEAQTCISIGAFGVVERPAASDGFCFQQACTPCDVATCGKP